MHKINFVMYFYCITLYCIIILIKKGFCYHEHKDEVLKQLEENKGEYISGGQLATNLNVSRNSIWKAIKTLEKKTAIQ